MTSGDRLVVRSYQRIFRPERRIYQIEGHPLPVPGGVPLRWLGYASVALVTIVALSSRSLALSLLLAVAAAAAGLAIGGRSIALASGAAAAGAAELVGVMLAAVDWPLRLVVLPALLATVATQATPDGRPAHRYALSWIALQLRPARRSLGRRLPPAGAKRSVAASVWVAGDEHGALIGPARVWGPATVHFAMPMLLRCRRLPAWRRVARPAARADVIAGAAVVERVDLAAGERLEVRP